MSADFKQLSLDILRDIYGGSRRLAMYPLGHPITQETLKKPLSGLNDIFLIKHSFAIELFKERLLAEGMLLEDTVYVAGLALDLKKHKLQNAVLYSHITVGDLYNFLSILVSRPGPFEDNVARILKSKNMDAVDVNVKNPPKLFSFDTDDLSDANRRFDIGERVNQVIAEKPDVIALYYMGRLKHDEDVREQLGVDFRLGYLANYFKEALKCLDRDKGLKLLEDAILSTSWLDDSVEPQTILGLQRLFCDYLSENPDQEVLSSIYQLFKKVGAPENVMNQVFNKSSILKLKTFQESETIVNTLKCADPSRVDPAALKKTVFKLAASQQRVYMQDLLDQLMRSLSSPTNELRQKAIHLVATAAEVLANGGFFQEYNHICKETVRLSLMPTDTLEPVELAAELAWLALKNSRWQEFKFLCRTLKGVTEDRFQAESKKSAAGKKLAEISESSQLARVVGNLLEHNWSEEANDFFEGFGSLGSKDIIRMLASKITHPDINVRSRVIKLLVSMKKDSAEILTEMLKEMVDRVKGGVISEDEWYYFRNILRVLRDVRAEECLPYLEMMISWPIVRMKIEVIKTLDGMSAAGAGKLLEKLTHDGSFEVRKSAVMAMGLSGHPDMVPRLRDIFLRDPGCRPVAIASLGRIGGTQARDILIGIFEDDQLFRDLGISKRDSEAIRMTILKALSIIGDEVAVQKLAEYSEKGLAKSLFKKDLISSTARIILGDRRK
jgi:HEAT repeat protein